MKLADADGAAAAAQYFFDLYSFAIVSGDTMSLEAMSDPQCRYCHSVVTNVRASVDAGRSTTGGEITTTVTRASEITEGNFWIDLAMESKPIQTVDKSGTPFQTGDGGVGTATIIVVGGPDHWAIRAVETHRADESS